MQVTSRYKYVLLASLYFAQFLPFAFFISSLPVILRRQGHSLEEISFLYALGLPYALKFLWAPFVDRGAGQRNHYKKWILILTLLYAACMLGALFFRPETGRFGFLFAFLALGMFFLSTQDIAVDALATRMLNHSERGVGNGLQAAGGFMGYFVGGGILLMTYDFLGWSSTLILLASLLILSLIPLFFLNEPQTPNSSRAAFSSLATFFRRKDILIPMLLAVFCGLPLQMAYHKFRPFMADVGFSNEEIGFYIGLVGMASGICFSILTGFFLKRLEMKKTMISVLLLTGICIPFLILPTLGYLQPVFLWTAVLAGGGMSGAVHAVSYAFYMHYARQGSEGSDFTLQNALSFLIGSMFMPFGGMIGDRFGYMVLFSIALFMQVVLTLAALRYFYRKLKLS
jgi:PAT family beta-lactamase induction signal transducer AmpG